MKVFHKIPVYFKGWLPFGSLTYLIKSDDKTSPDNKRTTTRIFREHPPEAIPETESQVETFETFSQSDGKNI